MNDEETLLKALENVNMASKLISNYIMGSRGANPEPEPPVPGQVLDAPWQLGDIGTPPVSGNATTQAGKMTVSGTGDINSTADAATTVYEVVSGDCAIVTTIKSLTGEDQFSAINIFMRDSLDPGAVYAMVGKDLRTVNGPRFQHRILADDNDAHEDVAEVIGPTNLGLRLTRVGNFVTGYYSLDGNNWTIIGSATVPFTGADILVGAVATSAGTTKPTVAVVDIPQVFEFNLADPGEFRFSVASQQIDEDGGIVGAVVKRVGGSDGVASVEVARDPSSTAVAGVDYVDPGFPVDVNLADGESVDTTVNVSILNRAGAQSNRQLKLALQNAVGAALGSPSLHVIDIIDTGSGVAEEILSEGVSNYFVDATNGNDSWNGKYASFKGGSNGPWKTINKVNGFSFNTNTDNLFLKTGEVWLGKTLWNLSITGNTSRQGKFIIGAYYLDGSIPRRGLGGRSRPINRGMSTFPDFTMAPWPLTRYPVSQYDGLFKFNPASYIRVENLQAENSGGHGFQFQGTNRSNPVRGVEVFNCVSDWTYNAGFHGRYFTDGLYDTCYAHAGQFIAKLSGDDWAAAYSMTGGSGGKMRNCFCWENFGEAYAVSEADKMLIEDNFALDNRAVDGVYVDATGNSIIRRNLSGKTSRQLWWRKPGNYRSYGAFISASEAYHFATNGGPIPDTQVNRDNVWYSNIAVGASSGFVMAFSGVAGQQTNAGRNEYWYGNLAVACPSSFYRYNSYKGINGRAWDNVFLKAGSSIANPGVTVGDLSSIFDHNLGYSNFTQVGTNFLVGGHIVDETAGLWDNCVQLVPNTVARGVSIEDIITLKALMQAKLQMIQDGAWEGKGTSISGRTFPPGITIEAGPANTDYNGDLYTNPDIGPYAS